MSSTIIAASFLVGILAGRADLWPEELESETISVLLLYVLLLLIGITAGADQRTWSSLRSSGPRVLLSPACAVIGSAIGASIPGWALADWSVRETMAVGFGLGYYSLSSVLIERIHGSELAIVALLANILREFTTMIAAGPFCRLFGPLAPIASGGATSSDTTLPAILAASGEEYAIPAVFNGIVLTFLVPVLVTFVLAF